MSASELTITSGSGETLVLPWSTLATAVVHAQARVESNAWIKRLRLVPYGDVPMRDRFTYRGDSLWWFTELYLHKMRRLETAVVTVLVLDAVRARHAPARLALSGADATTAAAGRAWGAARGVIVATPGAPPLSLTDRRREAAAVGWSAYAARLLRRQSRPAPAAIAAIVHTAFWRDQDTYVGPVIEAVTQRAGPGALRLVGVGPRRTFAGATGATGEGPGGAGPLARLETMTPLSALRGALALWRDRHARAADVTRGDAIRAAARVHDVDLWPILEHQLRATALVQWTWSARTMDELGSALDHLQSHTVVTYAEAGGIGRAMVLEARRRGIRSIGLQHGFIYRHWLNYLHEPDEFDVHGDDRGCPIPDLTLLFDGYAESHLRTAGHFPAGNLLVTGSPRLDTLAARLSAMTPEARIATREAVGAVRPEQTVAVLAAKFSEVRDDLPALVEAVRAQPDIHLVIKAHPAESADVYTPLVDGIYNITVAGADLDLASLLGAADVIVTKNSTVAIDGLVLGIPAVVIGLPNNLSPFVDAGVMVGAHGDVGQALRAVLYDQEVRATLKDATVAFVAAHGLRASGTAATRAAEVIVR